ncbi:MAG: hypothetical protein ACT4TC_10110, partial [Myxococcaceae bacterium]
MMNTKAICANGIPFWRLRFAEAKVRLAAPEKASQKALNRLKSLPDDEKEGLLKTQAEAEFQAEILARRYDCDVGLLKEHLLKAAEHNFSYQTRVGLKLVGPTALLVAPLVPLIQVLLGQDSTDEEKSAARDQLLKRLGQGVTSMAMGVPVDFSNMDSITAALNSASQATQVDPSTGQAVIDPRIAAASNMMRSYYGDPMQGMGTYDPADSRQDRMLSVLMNEIARLQQGQQQLTNPALQNFGYPNTAPSNVVLPSMGTMGTLSNTGYPPWPYP